MHMYVWACGDQRLASEIFLTLLYLDFAGQWEGMFIHVPHWLAENSLLL